MDMGVSLEQQIYSLGIGIGRAGRLRKLFAESLEESATYFQRELPAMDFSFGTDGDDRWVMRLWGREVVWHSVMRGMPDESGETRGSVWFEFIATVSQPWEPDVANKKQLATVRLQADGIAKLVARGAEGEYTFEASRDTREFAARLGLALLKSDL
ncbi:hypothetical protein PVT67_11610 [Gallaecimonas kandeliae]|uniref:hypothetical protein n=1 Tax=Gallaecimonas kandeliae TaxID=3029055 RepID=UPI0026471D3F|nr:hypothetical protein [Gallaecimonas kandeliae]WKE64326.1 hypothetical protein PVT67_11610 [Gallaecimonas kandeliae]